VADAPSVEQPPANDGTFAMWIPLPSAQATAPPDGANDGCEKCPPSGFE
jgi:hypothetical protein